MCGIAGFIDPGRGLSSGELESAAERMARALNHRGPDGHGTWSDAKAGVAFSHRRLSILDLSEEGRQPMLSADGRYVISYNGEIYNFESIREELAGLRHAFRGHSDTEVILAAVSQWGVEGAIKRFIGIFAFALWDSSERVLYLARDHVGVKPLYYGLAGDNFVFASELKALRVHPGFSNPVDRGSLALFLRHGYIESPHSIYSGIRKLPPGTFLKMDPARGFESARPEPYWSARRAFKAGPAIADEEEAAARLEALLRDAVKMQMVADVPLGAFLSGGVDSSLVVALMQSASTRPVKTFTVGFEEVAYDEAGHARAIARHLGTDHTEIKLSPAEALEAVPLLPRMYDEPFADASQIPTFLVSRLARRDVTVSLSGDGGDELFGGYTKYAWARRIWNAAGWSPLPLRKAAAAMIRMTPPGVIDRAYSILAPALPRRLKFSRPGELAHRAASVLSGADRRGAYLALSSLWERPGEICPGAGEHETILTDSTRWPEAKDFSESMMLADLNGYLPDDILVKLDRASMAVSLEGRVPLLDHRVVELALNLPVGLKIRGGEGKFLLKRLLARHVPEELTDRPKMGFGIPLADWLRGPLREWAEGLLTEKSLKDAGLRPETVREKWTQHLSGARNWQNPLWAVLMFQGWQESVRMG